jgi:aspartyl-tRNA(Asn)/glutamyl-tRNA(Gln) amidotransferase subunit B
MIYQPTIGLEIHAELKTATKMFCSSANEPDCREPNTNVCPVCMGHPGTLPVINKQAVKSVLMVGLALGGRLADYSEFDRKNYFYPDLPKGYQISQYQFPLVQGGSLVGVDITRVHLEEDTARSQHGQSDEVLQKHGHDYSLVDFNRSGVPLMELVTEPVVHDADKAAEFARELQLLLRYLGASDANMEKGEMRVEANISVKRKAQSEKLGTKVEVKNLNSIRAVKQAIAYEIDRQTKLLESGASVVQETRGWDEAKQSTFSQRLKEESHDYRYFPEPDLPKIVISQIPEFSAEQLRLGMPELPAVRRERYQSEYGLRLDTADTLVNNMVIGRFFDAATTAAGGEREIIVKAANYISADLAGLAAQAKEPDVLVGRIEPGHFVELIRMAVKGELSSRGVKDILKAMSESGGEPGALAKKMNLVQMNDDGDLKKIVELVIADQPKAVEDYLCGKEASLQYLVGQAMKASRGAANPEAARQIFIEILQRIPKDKDIH